MVNGASKSVYTIECFSFWKTKIFIQQCQSDNMAMDEDQIAKDVKKSLRK